MLNSISLRALVPVKRSSYNSCFSRGPAFALDNTGKTGHVGGMRRKPEAQVEKWPKSLAMEDQGPEHRGGHFTKSEKRQEFKNRPFYIPSYQLDWTRGAAGGIVSSDFTSANGGIAGNQGFSWEIITWDANGYGTDVSGFSTTNGDFSTNSRTTYSAWADPTLYMGTPGTCETADCDTSACVTDLYYTWWDPDPDYDIVSTNDHYQTQVAYVQGGLAVPVQYVVEFTANASSSPNNGASGWWPIPYPAISMAGGRLGADGLYQKVVQSGAQAFDCTPNFDGGPGANNVRSAVIIPSFLQPYKIFNVGGTSHKAVIFAYVGGGSGSEIDEYNLVTACVGQNVEFDLGFDPPLSYVNAVAHWNLPGSYVNYSWQLTNYNVYSGPVPVGSLNYGIDPSLLQAVSTSCWFYDTPTGTTPFGPNTSVGASLLFVNGKTVGVAAIGSVLIYRPSVVANETSLRGQPFFVTSSQGFLTYLAVGLPTFAHTMSFNAHVESSYPGTAGWTQLLNGSQTTGIYTYSTSGFELDNKEYMGPIVGLDGTPDSQGPVPVSDGPGIACPIYGGLASEYLTFIDYLRFTPSGNNSIAVTLQTGVWTAFGSAIVSGGGWVVNSGSCVGGPEFVRSSNFPKWNSVDQNSILAQ